MWLNLIILNISGVLDSGEYERRIQNRGAK